jgi:hypothetical protein
MLKLSLTTSEKIETLLNELIKGLGWTAVMFTAVIILVALWVIFRVDIQEALRSAQGLMFG